MRDVKKSEPSERSILKIGVYEHYKSTPEYRKYYRVLGIAKHTETGETFVVYLPMYEIEEDTNFQFFVRPLDMFTENVEHEGEVVPRFRYVGPEI